MRIRKEILYIMLIALFMGLGAIARINNNLITIIYFVTLGKLILELKERKGL